MSQHPPETPSHPAAGLEKKNGAPTLEPLAAPLAEARPVRLAPKPVVQSHDIDWSFSRPRTPSKDPVPVKRSPRIRILLLLLMMTVLGCVAIWTPTGLQAVTASAFELLLATEVKPVRTSAGPGPLVGQLEVTFTPSGAEVFPNWSKHRSPDGRRQLFTSILDRIGERPGVVSAAAASGIPLEGQPTQQQAFEIEGRRYDDPDLRPRLDVRVASPSYFETIGVPLRSGRAFSRLDDHEAAPVAIISQSLSRRHWPDEPPLDRRVTLDGDNSWLTIVGVVGDVRHAGLDADASDALYRPFLQAPGATRILVRARRDPVGLATEMREAVRSVDAEQPVERFATLADTRDNSLATRRVTLLLLGGFALLALVITAAGIAGVMATSVGQRTREFGVRLALGAAPGSLLTTVVGQRLAMVAIGLVLGIGGALVSSRILAGFLYGTTPTDPLTFLGVSVVLIAVAALACAVPARRALRVDPMITLRHG